MTATAAPNGASAPGRPVFAGDSGFYRDLKQRVAAYFAETGQARTGGLAGKALVTLAWFAASYAVFLAAETTPLRLVAAVSLGAAAAGVGFNIFHDSNHQSLVRGKSGNDAIAIATCLLLGPSRFLWQQKHHVFHHRFTNLHTWDDDIETRGFLRMSPDQPHRPWHRLQLFYWPAIYAVATLEWFFVKDFKQYFSGKLNPYQDRPQMSPAQHAEFWLTKGVYIAGFVVLPIWLLGPGPALAGLLVFHLVFGLILTAVFQLAHMNDQAEFPHVADDGRTVEDEWAAHQLRTTADFAPENPVALWYFGGLNFQVEHHLFPGVSHRHYPALARIVAETARAYGLPHHSYPTWRAAIGGHLRDPGAACPPRLRPGGGRHDDTSRSMTASRTASRAENLVTELMESADVRVNGDRPWDIQVHDARFFDRMIRHGQLGIGEAYMDGWWDCARIDEMSARFIRANLHHESIRDRRFIGYYLKQRLKGIGRKSLAYEVGEAHYDLSNEMFASFLDDTMSYSCAYWPGAETLEQAQRAKLDLICRKLDLKPGMKVLEIGCGWGGWARHAAEHYGVEVVGVTVSKEQLAWAREKCAGLPVRFDLMDYRDVKGSYDRVVSIAMFEAVGQKYFRTFMETVDRVLKPDGLFLLHTITSNTPIESAQSRWLNTYIFPNGELPSLAQVYKAAEGLFVAEAAHHLDGDYQRTLAESDAPLRRQLADDRAGVRPAVLPDVALLSADQPGHLQIAPVPSVAFRFFQDGIPGLDISRTGTTYPHADSR